MGIYRERNNKIGREEKAIIVEHMTKNGKINQVRFSKNTKFFVYNKLGIYACGIKFASLL